MTPGRTVTGGIPEQPAPSQPVIHVFAATANKSARIPARGTPRGQHRAVAVTPHRVLRLQATLAVVCELAPCGALKSDHRAGFRRANKIPSPTSLFAPASREIDSERSQIVTASDGLIRSLLATAAGLRSNRHANSVSRCRLLRVDSARRTRLPRHGLRRHERSV